MQNPATKLVYLNGFSRAAIFFACAIAAASVVTGSVGVRNASSDTGPCRTGNADTGNSIAVFLSLITAYSALYFSVTALLLLVFVTPQTKKATRRRWMRDFSALRLATYNTYTLFSVFFLSAWFATSANATFQCKNTYAAWLFAASCLNIALLMGVTMGGGIEIIGGQIGREKTASG